MKLMNKVAGILLLLALFGVRVSAQELSLYGPLPIPSAPVSPPPENLLFGIPKPHLSKPHIPKPTRANFELGGGYMYRSLLEADSHRLNMNGFSMYADYRIFRWLSAAADLSGAYNINSVNGNTQIYTLMFGARVYPLGHRHKITPFGATRAAVRPLLRFPMIFRRHYTLLGFPSILVCRCVPTY